MLNAGMLHPILCDLPRWSRWWWRHWLNPRTYWCELRIFWQRGLRGYSWYDVMDLDAYVAHVIEGGCRKLARDHFGHPTNMTGEEWTAVLLKLADGFKQPDDEWPDDPEWPSEETWALLREHFRSLWQ